MICSSYSWSFWGSEEETEEKDDAVREDTNQQINSEKLDNPDSVETNKAEGAKEEEGKKYTLDEINQMNKEELEKKMEEVVRAHEAHHLSQEHHFDELGEHNAEFDHQAFMGDEAQEFRNLTPEESKEKLSKIAVKIDTNDDKLIDVDELTKWIIDTQNRSVVRWELIPII